MDKIIKLSPEVIGRYRSQQGGRRAAQRRRQGAGRKQLDAGSSAITVDIREGGMSSSASATASSGIPESELRMAFERHATGQAAHAEDLLRIATLGFRGKRSAPSPRSPK